MLSLERAQKSQTIFRPLKGLNWVVGGYAGMEWKFPFWVIRTSRSLREGMAMFVHTAQLYLLQDLC